MVPDVLVDPNAFFEREARSPGWLRPTGIVILAALVSIAGSVPILQASFRNLPPEVGAFSLVFYIIGVLAGFVATLLFWLLYAGSFHVISAVAFGGSGSFGDTLKLAGWGFIPHVFAGIVSASVNVYVFSDVTFPSDPTAIDAFVTSLRSRPVFLVTELLSVAFLLWSGFLWMFAMSHGRNLPLREAAITVGIPVAFALLFRVYSMMGGL